MASAMDSGGGRSPSISPESIFRLREGICVVLSRWAALQVAIRNEWGGGDSRRKYDELASALLSLFSQPQVLLSTEDLESALEEQMILSFDTMVDDGSVEEIAEQLMILHEECLQGNYEPIEKLNPIPAEDCYFYYFYAETGPMKIF